MKTNTLHDDVIIILDNVRSIHNVGSIFRTADALAIRTIFLCGITPTPIDRFGRERTDLHKAALGAEKNVLWEQHASTLDAVTFLKHKGYSVVCVEQSETSIDYKEYSFKNKTVFVFGNEVDGISNEILSTADTICEIDMKGKKESLNISVSFGIVMFRILNQ